MMSEQLGPSAIKLILTPEEAAELPSSQYGELLRQYIRCLADRIRSEGVLSLPHGKLLAEIYMISDGSCVIFISATERSSTAKRLYACELSGIERLTGLMDVLADSGAYCSLYCGCEPQEYRIIFSEPSADIGHICREYGDYSEISELFAAQTAEYLTAIAEDIPVNVLRELLG